MYDNLCWIFLQFLQKIILPNWILTDFGAAEYESDFRSYKFKMAGPIWIQIPNAYAVPKNSQLLLMTLNSQCMQLLLGIAVIQKMCA